MDRVSLDSPFGKVSVSTEPQSINQEPADVPRFTRENVVAIIKCLWHLDLDMTFERDENAPTITYLLDDLMKVLRGGIYTIAYPTDYGKSTLIEMSVVLSLIFWPKDTINTIVKANEDAAVAAARTCWWKLNLAAQYFWYAKPLSALRQGNPEVKKGFFIEGSELRTFGGRDPSVYPAGIGDSSLPGRRGRAHFDDLETENTVKSEAKMDTLRKQFNSCVRLIQRHARFLFMLAGTPQGSNSLIYMSKRDFSTVGVDVEFIFRPDVIRSGPHSGELLFPAAKLKQQIQSKLMDPNAYKIAYQLVVPGEGSYDGKFVIDRLKNPTMPWPSNEAEFRAWLPQFVYTRYQNRVGFDQRLRSEADLYRYAEASAGQCRIYLGWDPATSGTFSQHIVALLPEYRFILRSLIDSGTPDEQAQLIKLARALFPSLTVILEKDAQQLAFASVLMHVDPTCPWAPHQTHGYNKDAPLIGIPTLMQEFMNGLWSIPWPNDDFGTEQFGSLLDELEWWGPVSHPHGIPSIWFPWFFETSASAPVDTSSHAGENQSFQVVTEPAIIAPFQDPIQPQNPWGGPAVSEESKEAWSRRWEPYRE